MYIVVFSDKRAAAERASRNIVLGICDHVNGRTMYNGMSIVIDSRNIRIDMRPADLTKAAGLVTDYVLFYEASTEFIQEWRYVRGGRYIELKTLDELIQLVIKED